MKTRAEGQSEPLMSVIAAHVCQVQLQMKCTEMEHTILQSYVPETEKSKYFLIAMNDNVITLFLELCASAINSYALQFESFLPMRQLAGTIPKDCPEISFEKV